MVRQGAHCIVDNEETSQKEVVPRVVGLLEHIRDLGWSGRGVDLCQMRLPELETQISLLRVSNHGGSVCYRESNRLGAGAEVRTVKESTTDEVDMGSRLEQHKQIPGGPIRHGHGECDRNLEAFGSVSNLVDFDGGVFAQ